MYRRLVTSQQQDSSSLTIYAHEGLFQNLGPQHVYVQYTHLNPGKEAIPPTTRIFSLRALRQSEEHCKEQHCII